MKYRSPPYIWPLLHRTNLRWGFGKILWPSQNIWTLFYCKEVNDDGNSTIFIFFWSTLLISSWGLFEQCLLFLTMCGSAEWREMKAQVFLNVLCHIRRSRVREKHSPFTSLWHSCHSPCLLLVTTRPKP